MAFNKSIKNEDAIFKFLAYTGNLEKNRRENRQETLDNTILQQGGDVFSTYYLDMLWQDAFKEPREIDEEALQPKVNIKDNQLLQNKDKEYKTRLERREEYFDNYEEYKEGRLQQRERKQLYSILEEMFRRQ